MQTELAAHFVLRSNVRARSGIIAYENNRKTRRDAVGFQLRDLRPAIDINFVRNRAAIDQISHASNLDESPALNQRHHHILQTQSLTFKFVLGGGRSYLLRLADNHAHFRKWSRNDEPVPTFHTPAA